MITGSISVSDIEQFDILLANKMDGNPLKVRDFGPYFVIYPMDKFYDKLNSPTFQSPSYLAGQRHNGIRKMKLKRLIIQYLLVFLVLTGGFVWMYEQYFSQAIIYELSGTSRELRLGNR